MEREAMVDKTLVEREVTAEVSPWEDREVTTEASPSEAACLVEAALQEAVEETSCHLCTPQH